MTPKVCPLCGHNFEYQVNGTTYFDVVGVEIRGHYDGVLYWWDHKGCGKAFQRWDMAERLHAEAQPFIDRHNKGVVV